MPLCRHTLGLRLIRALIQLLLSHCPNTNFMVGYMTGGLDWDQTQSIVPPQQRAAQASLHCPGASLKALSGGPSFSNFSALLAVLRCAVCAAGLLGCAIPTLPVDPAAFVGAAGSRCCFQAHPGRRTHPWVAALTSRAISSGSPIL